jgi:predicted DNA-binding transcriptional regulator YafY
MIPRRGKIATTEIRSRLQSEYSIETTLRTVQRDLNDLSRTFPLESDNNSPAGWNWRKDAPAFDIPNMDPVTALTFKLAEKHIARMMPHGVMNALKPYIKVADERLKMTTRLSLSRWPDKVRVVSRNLPMIYPQIADDILDKVYTAVLEERRFGARYRTVEGKIKKYDVNPLGMAFVEGLTYLVASLNKHEDPVLLLLHRMLDVKPTDTPVTITEGFDLDEYTCELSFPAGDDINLKAFFSNKADIVRLRETPISEDQKITEKDEKWLLQATISDSNQLRWWLRGYGERVEVVGPKCLRQEFAVQASRLAKMYDCKM